MKLIALILFILMSVSPVGIKLIKYYEGLRLITYRCPANVLTIGWGHTGKDVKAGDKITADSADILLVMDLRVRFEPYLNRLGPLKWNEYDALGSFIFNVGPGKLVGDLRTAIVQGNMPLVAVILRRYVKAKVNGRYVVLGGLVKRRNKEVNLLLNGTLI